MLIADFSLVTWMPVNSVIRKLTCWQFYGRSYPNQWSGGYYGYTPVYAAYGYAQPTQDPNMSYAGYAGYENYAQPPHQQQVN